MTGWIRFAALTALGLLPGCAFMQMEADKYGYYRDGRYPGDCNGFGLPVMGPSASGIDFHGGAYKGPEHLSLPGIKGIGIGKGK